MNSGFLSVQNILSIIKVGTRTCNFSCSFSWVWKVIRASGVTRLAKW